MARLPKPTALKEFHGNPGKRPLNKTPQPPPLEDVPKPPAGIGKYARRFWLENTAGLYYTGRLTVLDLAAWREVAKIYQLLCQAEDELALEGALTMETDNGLRTSPALTIRDKQHDRYMAGLREFGMTPVSRERARGEAPEKEDELTALLKAVA